MTDRSQPDALRAFAAAPVASRYYPASAIEAARGAIGRNLERRGGPSLVIGNAGVGKTMLLEVLAEQFRDQTSVVPLAGAQLCTRRALLQMILFQLRLPFRSLDEGELRLSVLEYLRPAEGPARQILLLVDEADSLPTRLLEELRVLTNISDRGQMLASVVLFGGATLEELFADPKLEMFSQRVATRCYLSALGREEMIDYVRVQTAADGIDPDVLFTPEALEALFAATDGVPRLVNQLASQLLWMVETHRCQPIDADHVQQAWSDLQQLPAPWDQTPPELPNNAVEFGELTDEPLSREVQASHFDLQEDLPASIPISTAACASTDDTEDEPLDTRAFDSTELMLEQLDQQRNKNSESFESAHDPFNEVFEAEELIVDRYADFEEKLLLSAQRVVNQVDYDFSLQLRALETSVESMPRSAPVEESADCSPTMQEPDEPPVGELLVVEDVDRPKTEVVTGARFRQLFSSLESAGGAAV